MTSVDICGKTQKMEHAEFLRLVNLLRKNWRIFKNPRQTETVDFILVRPDQAAVTISHKAFSTTKGYRNSCVAYKHKNLRQNLCDFVLCTRSDYNYAFLIDAPEFITTARRVEPLKLVERSPWVVFLSRSFVMEIRRM